MSRGARFALVVGVAIWSVAAAAAPASKEAPSTTDDQFERVTPSGVSDGPLDADGRRALEVRGEFGRGVQFATPSNSFAVHLRGRVQLQAAARVTPSDEDETWRGDALARRLRLLLGGHALHRRLTFYIQLGFSSRDLESDQQVPLRDAFITWHARPWLNLRVGQMKVPFDRQRVMSSSRLQLVERAEVVGALNLDRDVGAQLYGDVGTRRLRYFAGVFQGEGRNRASAGDGALVMGRLLWMPLGAFSEAAESDLEGGPWRLSLSVAGGVNQGSARVRSTQGAFLPAEGRVDQRHLAAELLVKRAGWSLSAHALLRDSANARTTSDDPTAQAAVEAAIEDALGLLLQTGYLITPRWEIAGRWGRLLPRTPANGRTTTDEFTLGVSWLRVRHDLKLQLNATALRREDAPDTLVGRAQLQLFF